MESLPSHTSSLKVKINQRIAKTYHNQTKAKVEIIIQSKSLEIDSKDLHLLQILGVKYGAQSKRIQKIMRDPLISIKKAFSHQIWWRFEQKMFFDPYLTPLDLFWGFKYGAQSKRIEKLMKDPLINRKRATSHQIWWRLEQKWLFIPIWPPLPLTGVK